MSDSKSKVRREFRNVEIQQIVRYRNAFPQLVSILHRISGALIFLSLPILISLFMASVASPAHFAELGSGVGGFFLKLILLAVLWGFMHHLCAGIRFLMLDLHYGLEKAQAAKSAQIVLVVSVVLTLIFAIKLFGVL